MAEGVSSGRALRSYQLILVLAAGWALGRMPNWLAAETAELGTVLLVGAPIRRNGRLYNCALAIARGVILGAVPKSFLPNYREYYEKRWFASGAELSGLKTQIAGQNVPFGTDLLFAAEDLADFIFAGAFDQVGNELG